VKASEKALHAAAVAELGQHSTGLAAPEAWEGAGDLTRARFIEVASAGLEAAHDPTLGLDRSVCLRDVVEALREYAQPLASDGGDDLDEMEGGVVNAAADFIAARFTDEGKADQ